MKNILVRVLKKDLMKMGSETLFKVVTLWI